MDDVTITSQLFGGTDTSASRGGCVLVLGDVALWRASGRKTSETKELCLAELDEISSSTLADIGPDLVLSPIVAARFDCFDVARRLSELNYSGSYRAIALDLPNPQMVRNEILKECPDLDFDILLIPKLDGLAN